MDGYEVETRHSKFHVKKIRTLLTHSDISNLSHKIKILIIPNRSSSKNIMPSVVRLAMIPSKVISTTSSRFIAPTIISVRSMSMAEDIKRKVR